MTVTITRTDDLAVCLAIRTKVFVEEQSVPVELERDEHDETALHLLATDEDHPIGTARIVLQGDTGKIGRVAVLAEQRGTGLGRKLIEACVEELGGIEEITQAKLGAQISAIGFYEKLGFTAFGPEFDDAGIAHKMMSRTL